MSIMSGTCTENILGSVRTNTGSLSIIYYLGFTNTIIYTIPHGIYHRHTIILYKYTLIK